MAFLSQKKAAELLAETASSGGGRYFNVAKIEDGTESRIRIMDMEAVSGWEAWTTDNKPVRYSVKPEEIPENIKTDDNGAKMMKKFVAAIIYDYSDGSFKCMSLTQKTLYETLYKYIADEDYGDPIGYDIKIGRTGKLLLTNYTFVPTPPKPLSEKISNEWDKIKSTASLERLFLGEEVFI